VTEGRLLQIGKVAERTGLSLRTVRYYEETGLVVPSGRTDGGFRLYSDADVDRLLAVKAMKPLGLTLDEMADLLALLDRTAAPQELSGRELDRANAELDAYVERTHDRIRKLQRDLANARDLAQQLAARIDACAAPRTRGR
jgi:DNA-binding transcriptional MerR regulator